MVAERQLKKKKAHHGRQIQDDKQSSYFPLEIDSEIKSTDNQSDLISPKYFV